MVGWLTQQLDASSRGSAIVRDNIRSVKRDAVIGRVTAALDVSIYCQIYVLDINI
jgi:hypothetical protein